MNKTLLLVDDDLDVLEFLALQFSERGCHVLRATDARAALDIIRGQAGKIDLVLSDLRMPDVDGMQLLQRIVALHANLPVVLMSAQADLDLALETIRAGAIDLCLKPLVGAEIERILQRLEQFHDFRPSRAELALPMFSERLEIEIPSARPLARKIVGRVNEYFQPALLYLGFRPGQFRVCLQEAVENALVHGNLGIDSDLKERDWAAFEALVAERAMQKSDLPVRVTLNFTSEGMSCEVRDQGEGFDPGGLSLVEDRVLCSSGRGLLLIQSIMDEVNWTDHGRCIRMQKKRQAPDRAEA